nr:DNA double-strand break repair Rad50 ATPase [Ipomoea batatas]
MENQEDGPMHEYREKILHIFSDFMTRVALFEELLSVGNRLLVGFQQGLEYVQRPPIEKKSELVERIIRDNETKRLLSYIEAGYKNTNDGIQNINKCKFISSYIHMQFCFFSVCRNKEFISLAFFKLRVQ